MFAIAFPTIDPVALELGPILIRWYSLAYIAGILLGWQFMLRLSRLTINKIDRKFIDDFIIYSYVDVLPGDLNFDTTLNVLDVIILVNMVLGFESPNYSAGDINSDSVINILDVVSLVSLILDI